MASNTQIHGAIIGLDRITASLGLILRAEASNPGSDLGTDFTLTGWDAESGAAAAAVKSGALSTAAGSPPLCVQEADFVICSLGMNATQGAFDAFGRALKPGAVVLDLSPLKTPALGWAKSSFPHDGQGNPTAYLIGARMIPGQAGLIDPRTGIDAARIDLFKDGLLILAPDSDCPIEAVSLISDLADLMNIRVHYSDPIEHDGIVGAMDGMPLLMQLLLFRSLKNSFSWDDLRRFGGSRFHFGTLALLPGRSQTAQQTAEELGAQVAALRPALLGRLNALRDEIDDLRELLMKGDDLAVAEAFESAVNQRAEWEMTRTKITNIAQDTGRIESPFRPFGGLLGRLGGKPKKAGK